ncbi:heme biosynthesis HemY N-terminal domain-containing protein [Kistimonas asteriae]|uniref:heme biosynthesis HemY N-terminal domain-containing protein n=1 Tax=Kistimonas asteriae TaxID=517724 RepID=UPI001BA59D88|nr:heme biosynthesis HemY N-terminal domain-containing protein [Kistimonas asteriae]
MKKTLFLLLLVAACFAIAQMMVHDSGYVLIAYDRFSLEGSVWSFFMAAVLLIAGYKIITWGFRLLAGSISLAYPMTQKSKRRRAQRQSAKGLIQFANGHWKAAQKLLAHAAESGQAPLLNYLAAARAAHENGDYDACSDYLRKADASAPGADIAIGITQAELLLARGRLEQALATLKRLRKRSPKHTYVNKLLKQVYLRLHDWQALAELLPTLRKLKVISSEEFDSLNQQAYKALFEQAYQQGKGQSDIEERIRPAEAIWQKLSKAQKKEDYLFYDFVSCLTRLGAEKRAEAVMRRHLSDLYSERIIRLYGQIEGEDKERQLLGAEKLLDERPNDAELFLTLGRLCIHNKLWGKAREYLEASLRLRKQADTYNELGQLLAQLGEHEKSTEFFRQGLSMTVAMQE